MIGSCDINLISYKVRIAHRIRFRIACISQQASIFLLQAYGENVLSFDFVLDRLGLDQLPYIERYISIHSYISSIMYLIFTLLSIYLFVRIDP